MLSLVLILYFASVLFIVALFLAPIVMRRLWKLVDLRHQRLRSEDHSPLALALPPQKRPAARVSYRGGQTPKLYVV